MPWLERYGKQDEAALCQSLCGALGRKRNVGHLAGGYFDVRTRGSSPMHRGRAPWLWVWILCKGQVNLNQEKSRKVYGKSKKKTGKLNIFFAKTHSKPLCSSTFSEESMRNPRGRCYRCGRCDRWAWGSDPLEKSLQYCWSLLWSVLWFKLTSDHLYYQAKLDISSTCVCACSRTGRH